MGFLKRVVLGLAALSPGVVFLTLQEFAVSMAFLVLGLFGALGVAAVAVAMSPPVKHVPSSASLSRQDYPSLILASALPELRDAAPDPLQLRAVLQTMMAPPATDQGGLTEDQQIAMVLSQIMARWGKSDTMTLTDDQARELWLVDQLMRATPAQAGALAGYFTAPNAMLTMRDTLAAPISA